MAARFKCIEHPIDYPTKLVDALNRIAEKIGRNISVGNKLAPGIYNPNFVILQETEFSHTHSISGVEIKCGCNKANGLPDFITRETYPKITVSPSELSPKILLLLITGICRAIGVTAVDSLPLTLEEAMFVSAYFTQLLQEENRSQKIDQLTVEIERYSNLLNASLNKIIQLHATINSFTYTETKTKVDAVKNHPLVKEITFAIDTTSGALTIKIVTNPILLDVNEAKLPIGQFVITWDGLQINIQSFSGASPRHPHIGGYICWGGFGTTILQNIKDGNIIGALDHLKLYLQSFSPGGILRELSSVMSGRGISIRELQWLEWKPPLLSPALSARPVPAAKTTTEDTVDEEELLIRPNEIGTLQAAPNPAPNDWDDNEIPAANPPTNIAF